MYVSLPIIRKIGTPIHIKSAGGNDNLNTGMVYIMWNDIYYMI